MDILEKLYRNSGLLHVAEHVIGFMDNSTVAQCRLVNKESNEFLSKIWQARVMEEAQKLCELKFETCSAEINKGDRSESPDPEEKCEKSIFELWPDWKVALKEITSCDDLCRVTSFLQQYISKRTYRFTFTYIGSPLHFAARNPRGDWADVIEILTSTSLDFNEYEALQRFPSILHSACLYGHQDTVKILMKSAAKKDIDVNALVPETNWSIVHSAIRHEEKKPGHPVLKCLYNHRKEFDFDFSQPLPTGTPILHFSIGSDSFQLEAFEIMVQWVQETGISLSAVDDCGENIIHYACASAPEAALLMLEWGDKCKFGFDRNLLTSMLRTTNNDDKRPIDLAKSTRLPSKRRNTWIQVLEKYTESEYRNEDEYYSYFE